MPSILDSAFALGKIFKIVSNSKDNTVCSKIWNIATALNLELLLWSCSWSWELFKISQPFELTNFGPWPKNPCWLFHGIQVSGNNIVKKFSISLSMPCHEPFNPHQLQLWGSCNWLIQLLTVSCISCVKRISNPIFKISVKSNQLNSRAMTKVGASSFLQQFNLHRCSSSLLYSVCQCNAVLVAIHFNWSTSISPPCRRWPFDLSFT